MRFREIELLRTERDRIVVAGGLEPGERVCTSALDATIDGMLVRVAPVEGAGPEAVAKGGEDAGGAGAIP